MIKYLVDTNVFLRIFKGDSEVADFIADLEIAIDATIYIECIQGSKSNQEKQKIKQVLDNLPLFVFSREISETAIDLIDQYSNSHGLLIADALIASTAINYDLTVVTYNVRDFHFVDSLKMLEPFE